MINDYELGLVYDKQINALFQLHINDHNRKVRFLER